jgi:hypothetical protein
VVAGYPRTVAGQSVKTSVVNRQKEKSAWRYGTARDSEESRRPVGRAWQAAAQEGKEDEREIRSPVVDWAGSEQRGRIGGGWGLVRRIFLSPVSLPRSASCALLAGLATGCEGLLGVVTGMQGRDLFGSCLVWKRVADRGGWDVLE